MPVSASFFSWDISAGAETVGVGAGEDDTASGVERCVCGLFSETTDTPRWRTTAEAPFGPGFDGVFSTGFLDTTFGETVFFAGFLAGTVVFGEPGGTGAGTSGHTSRSTYQTAVSGAAGTCSQYV